MEIITPTATIFPKFLAQIFSSQAAPKFENLSSQDPSFSGKYPSKYPKLHTSEIRAAHPYLKKSWVPPPGIWCTG